MDLRLAIMPTALGLRAAVRLPAELGRPHTLEQLGLPGQVMDGLRRFARGRPGDADRHRPCRVRQDDHDLRPAGAHRDGVARFEHHHPGRPGRAAPAGRDADRGEAVRRADLRAGAAEFAAPGPAGADARRDPRPGHRVAGAAGRPFRPPPRLHAARRHARRGRGAVAGDGDGAVPDHQQPVRRRRPAAPAAAARGAAGRGRLRGPGAGGGVRGDDPGVAPGGPRAGRTRTRWPAWSARGRGT